MHYIIFHGLPITHLFLLWQLNYGLLSMYMRSNDVASEPLPVLGGSCSLLRVMILKYLKVQVLLRFCLRARGP